MTGPSSPLDYVDALLDEWQEVIDGLREYVAVVLAERGKR